MMAKKELAVKLQVDEKVINKALVMLGQDVLSSEEIDKRFCSRDPFLFDVEMLGEDSFAMAMAFVALIEDDNRSKEGGDDNSN